MTSDVRITECLRCGAPLADLSPGHAVWCRPCSKAARDAGLAKAAMRGIR